MDLSKSIMLEKFLAALIEELGTNGILLIGLYVLLYRPLQAMALSLRTINDELGQILKILKKE